MIIFYILGAIGFIFLYLVFPFLRCVVNNPFKTIFYFLKDSFIYIKDRLWNRCPDGSILGMLRIYVGLFGKGKTLSAVMDITRYYKRYNGKRFRKGGKWLDQRVLVLSNVELNIPYLHLDSLSQITNLVHDMYDYDQEHNTYTCVLCLCDELGCNLNSRSFKDNIDPQFLNTLLTCRKYHLGFYGTAQVFDTVDKLLRSVTQEVVDCNKVWRLLGQKVYRGSDLSDTGVASELVKPIRRSCAFVRDKHYRAYNTYAMVDILEKKYKEGDFISEKEILELTTGDANENKVAHFSKLGNKRFKRRA